MSGTKALVMFGNFRRPEYSTCQITMHLPGVSNQLVATWLNHFTQGIGRHPLSGYGEKFLGLQGVCFANRRHGELFEKQIERLRKNLINEKEQGFRTLISTPFKTLMVTKQLTTPSYMDLSSEEPTKHCQRKHDGRGNWPVNGI